MSGIAEVHARRSATACKARTSADSYNVAAPARARHPGRDRPSRRESRRRQVVVVSSAVKRRQPGTRRGPRARGLPIVRRAEMLAELMRFKSCDRRRRHARQDHHHLARRGAARCRRSRSDGDQRRHHQCLWHQCAARRGRLDGGGGRRVRRHLRQAAGRRSSVVTNIDPEHLDHYGNFDAVADAYRAFVENIPFYGFAVMCIDHPEVQSLIGRDQGPPHHHLRQQPAGRCAARRRSGIGRATSSFASTIRDRRDRRAATDRGPAPADAGRAQRPRTPPPPSRSPTSSASATRRSAGACRASAA